jgi:uncharacterized protein YbbC (DUF1343 family)
MPDLESATHYPGTVIFEATNLSVGRGTPVAFQVIGAPWLDAVAVAALTGDHPGVRVTDTTVVPIAPPDDKFADTEIAAVKLRVTDRSVYDPVALAVALLAAVHERHPADLTVAPDRLARLLGTAEVWPEVRGGTAAARIVAGWQEALAAFRDARDPVLLYD